MKMNFYEAMNKSAEGYDIISNSGIIYSSNKLKPIWVGKNYAGYTSCGITKAEIEGKWHVGLT
jgi:hypothetical protein